MKLASAFKWISRIFGKLLCLLGLRQSCVYGWIAAVKKEEREKKEKKILAVMFHVVKYIYYDPKEHVKI